MVKNLVKYKECNIKEAKRMGTSHPSIVPYESFQTKDGFLTIGCGNDLQYQQVNSLCITIYYIFKWLSSIIKEIDRALLPWPNSHDTLLGIWGWWVKTPDRTLGNLWPRITKINPMVIPPRLKCAFNDWFYKAHCKKVWCCGLKKACE